MNYSISLKQGADPAGFKRAVRFLLAANAPPDDVSWGCQNLFGETPCADAPPVMLPQDLAALIALVICHRDPERFSLLYQAIWRTKHGESKLLQNPADPLVHRLHTLAKTIRRDLHKMHAFVRFRQTSTPDGAERFIAWFEPGHYILEATADFFIDRFRALHWSIITPIGALHWDTARLAIGPPGSKADWPAEDEFEAGWCTYYESIFNPARVNPTAMRAEMSKKYWRNMPETRAIPALIRGAASRTRQMVETPAAAPEKRNPDKAVAAMANQAPQSLAELNRLIAASPPLVPGTIQAVLGEGPLGAPIAFVGEQPGDAEDSGGRPFIGPAGQLLNRALAQAGIIRAETYVTNAVKHFKFEERGKRRIHSKPTAGEVKHYRWWLLEELNFVKPRITVALGATALLALSGKPLPLLKSRGEMTFDDHPGYVTMHPSYLLRLPDAAAQQKAYADFVEDLRKIKELATS